MGLAELLERVEYLVDPSGKKKAVVVDYAVWEQLLTLLEDFADAEEIRRLRETGEEAIPWAEAKAELRAEGLDVYIAGILRRAIRDIASVPKDYAALVSQNIHGLAENPRPPGAKKLPGTMDYSLRVGV